ncbi:MAG: FHA domain-containing protein [Planctomycetes bacterium]|nr:FHA domain-containing protein [Planctomycetota bacterium]
MNEGTRIIGRSQSSDLVIPSARVSRRHCSLIPSGDGYVLQDHDSRNGIWVEGKRVKSAYLKKGDRFTVGSFRVRICRDGTLELEGKVDPKQMMVREKLRHDLPSIFAILICGLIILVIFLNRESKPAPTPLAQQLDLGDPLQIWTPEPDRQPASEEAGTGSSNVPSTVPGTVPSTDPDGEPSTDPASSAGEIDQTRLPSEWVTASGKSWTLEELLELAEAIDATDRSSTVTDSTAVAVLPGTDAGIDDESESLALPPTVDPWAEVARLRRDKRVRRRRAPLPTAVGSSATAASTDQTAVVESMSSQEWFDLGREALASYHLPDRVLPDFTLALQSLVEIATEESWHHLNLLRIEAKKLLRAVASRAKQIGLKYGHLDRNPDAPLSAQDRREAELALNLLVLIQEQMVVLLDARDLAFTELTDPEDPERLGFALSVALEDEDDELLDLVLEQMHSSIAEQLIPSLIKGLKTPAATRKLKVQATLQQITGQSFRSESEWERWWNSKEGSRG